MKNQRRPARPVGRMVEGKPIRNKPHPPKPVAHYITTPSGSKWECSLCGDLIPPDTQVLQFGGDVICAKCVKGGATLE